MDAKDVVWEAVEQINLSQDKDKQRAVSSSLKFIWVPQNAGNFLKR